MNDNRIKTGFREIEFLVISFPHSLVKNPTKNSNHAFRVANSLLMPYPRNRARIIRK